MNDRNRQRKPPNVSNARHTVITLLYGATFAVKFIREHWQDLTKHAKAIIIRDLDEALQSHEDDLRDNREYCHLGDQCDYQKWKNLREWINEQA